MTAYLIGLVCSVLITWPPAYYIFRSASRIQDRHLSVTPPLVVAFAPDVTFDATGMV